MHLLRNGSIVVNVGGGGGGRHNLWAILVLLVHCNFITATAPTAAPTATTTTAFITFPWSSTVLTYGFNIDSNTNTNTNTNTNFANRHIPPISTGRGRNFVHLPFINVSGSCGNSRAGRVRGRVPSRLFSINDGSNDHDGEYDKKGNSEWQWEDSMRNMAAEALIPVFYPNQSNNNGNVSINDNDNVTTDNSNLNNTQSRVGIDPEKALKKLLRRYQKSITSETNGTSTTAKERHASRKRLADLVLGTSIMRIRHYYSLFAALNSTNSNERNTNRNNISDSDSDSNSYNNTEQVKNHETKSNEIVPSIVSMTEVEVEPIIGLAYVVEKFENHNQMKVSNHNNTPETTKLRQMRTIRAMIDLHAEYMNNTQQKYDSDNDDDIHDTHNKNSSIRLNLNNFKSDSERISILYSLPTFIIDMLIKQYGVKATQEMAAIFNKSGPITIRRNSIKCPTDEMLCERLLKDDFVTAIPLSKQSLDSFSSISSSASASTDSGTSITTATATQSNSTTLVPPDGCIRLLVDKSWSPAKKSIWSMQAWKDGWFEVQDVGSQVIVEATEANCGDVVIDYCAGNGGKTFALASQMHQDYQHQQQGKGATHTSTSTKRPKGYIVSHDIVEERLRQLRGSFGRIGLKSPQSSLSLSSLDDSPESSDAVISDIIVKTSLDSMIVLEKEMADVVLVDAPCSSLGVLRRRPSQRFKLKEEEITIKFPCLQSSILIEASTLVNNGGRLVYATCSLSQYENEHVVKAFESQECFDDIWERWNFNDYDNCNASSSINVNDGGEVKVGESSHFRALLPNENDCDGFFIARWRRK